MMGSYHRYMAHRAYDAKAAERKAAEEAAFLASGFRHCRKCGATATKRAVSRDGFRTYYRCTEAVCAFTFSEYNSEV